MLDGESTFVSIIQMLQFPDYRPFASLVEYPRMDGPARVRLRDLSVRDESEREDLREILERFIEHGQWIMGEEVEKFEADIASFFKRKHCVSVASASSGLYLALKALGVGEGDEVITTPMSWLVTSSAVVLTGATPVFVDVDENYNLDPDAIQAAITHRTKAILPVHFYGRVAQISRIAEIAKRHGLALVEDVAQAVGGHVDGVFAGSFGDVGVMSFSPMKILAGIGDAGAIICDDDELAQNLRVLRHCGTVRGEICIAPELKHNIDALNAAVIRRRLRFLNETIEFRRGKALLYQENLEGVVACPDPGKDGMHTFFDYTIRTSNRDELIRHLFQERIEVKIRHPLLICDQPIYSHLPRPEVPRAREFVREILCLPLHTNISDVEVRLVAKQTRLLLSERS